MLLTDAIYSDLFISIAHLLFITQRSRSPQSPFNYVIHLRSPNRNLGEKSFEGQDVSIGISLKEYGVAWQVLGSKTKFVYGVEWDGSKGEYTTFDHCFFDTDIDVFSDFDWVEFDSIYSYTGLSADQWKELPMPQKIVDLLSYYGRENIFGM